MRSENWEQIRYFLAVANKGSLTGAASELRTTPSTVSRHIDDLELDLGVSLFTRDRSGYTLTVAGQRLLVHAENISRGTRAFFEEATTADGVVSGRVRLAASENFANFLIVPALPAFFERHPEISIDLLTGMSTLNVSKQEAEVAIRNQRPEAGNVVIKKLGIQAQAFYRAKSCKAADTTIKWATARDDFFIPSQLNEITQDHSAKLFTTSLYSQVVAARAGIGQAMLPCLIGDADPLLERVGDPVSSLQQELWLVYHQDLSKSQRIRAVVDFIEKLVLRNKALLEGR